MIILDSNILMLVEQKKIDISCVVEDAAVLSPCLEEMKKMALRNGKRGRAARIALEIIKRHSIRIVECTGSCDAAVIECSRRLHASVATVDKKLIKRLRAYGIEVLNIEGKTIKRGD